jgi:hypothetical protein
VKFNPPTPGSEYICIIDDRDGDEPFVTWHPTEEAAIARARDSYSNDRGETFPSPEEPGGNTYDEWETPNATIIVARVLHRSVL